MENNNNNNVYKPLPTDKPVENPILPKEGERNIIITSALPYVNNVPHLGNIVGSVLSADVYSRYCKLKGHNTIYVCGTDEYGTATETKALQEGLTPREICDKYNAIHREVYDWFDINFDKFGRTSTQAQETVCQEIFKNLHKNQHLIEEENQQLYCETCKKFLADRFVEGTCPLCSYKDARGDQCDSCGKLINAIELIQPRCKVDGTTPVVKPTKHLYIDLPKLSPQIEKFVDNSVKNGLWSANAVTITKSWLKEGLKPRAITRDLKWGVPVPLEDYKDKVFYVWYDAPIGYLSITANYTDQWTQWWRNNKNVELVQFMGKDNVPFHTVMFPGYLLGSDPEWTTLHSISTTEYLNYENDKFSKSRGIGVFGLDAKNSGIPSEVWRYYLLANRPEVSDSSFSWDDLKEKNNGELLANLGNFVNRALTFCKERLGGVIPSITTTEFDTKFIENVNKELTEYHNSLDKIHIKDGLKVAMAISKLGNVYFQETKPWELLKENKARCESVIGVILNLIKLLGIVFEPYMPSLSKKIATQLNFTSTKLPQKFELDLPTGHAIGTPQVLFRKLDDKEIAEYRSKFGGAKKSEVTFPADIRGAVIESVGDHPSDDALFLLQVSLGTEKRQVVARLKAHYKKEQLEGRHVVALCNLPPAEIKGCKSEAMLLVAEAKKKGSKETESVLLSCSEKVENWAGVKIEAEGAVTDGKPIQLKEFQKLDLKLNKEGKVAFKTSHVLKANVSKDSSFTITAVGVEGPTKIK